MNKIRTSITNLSVETTSILWMLLSCFLLAVMGIIIKHLVENVPPLQLVFCRNLFSVVLMLPWAFKYGLPHVKAANFRLYGLRSLCSLFAMSMFFYAISQIALTDTIAITFVAPIFTTLFAIIFLKEQVGMHRWIAIIGGFTGVLIIVRPGSGDFQYAYFFIIASTIAWAFSNILIKKISNTDHPRAMVLIMMLLITPLTFPAALYVWQDISMIDVLWIIILAVATNEAQFCMNKAYKNVEISVVMPFDFSKLVFTSILAYIFFAEIITVWTLIGSIVIFSSAVYIVHRERILKKEHSCHPET